MLYNTCGIAMTDCMLTVQTQQLDLVMNSIKFDTRDSHTPTPCLVKQKGWICMLFASTYTLGRASASETNVEPSMQLPKLLRPHCLHSQVATAESLNMIFSTANSQVS